MGNLVLAILLFCCLWSSIALTVALVRFAQNRLMFTLNGVVSIVAFLWALFFYLMRVL